MSASTTLRPGSGPAAGQTAVRPSRRRRRRWVGLLIVLLVVALLAAAGWLVAFSSVLATRQVTVTGERILSADQIRAAAQVPIGRPMARQHTTAIATRVAALRPVRTVEVTRHWPRTLTISVQERTPVLAIAQPAGFVLVDATGAAYLNVAKVPDGVFQAGVDPSNAALLTQVGEVAHALTPELATKVSIIKATSADGISLQLRDGDTVVWGSSDDSALKSEVTVALLKQPASTYDVSAPHSPSIR